MLPQKFKLCLFITLFFYLPQIAFSFEWDTDLLLSDLASPITTDAKWGLLGGTALTSYLFFDKHHDLDGQTKDNVDYNPPLKHYGHLGEIIGWGYLNGLYMVGFGLHHYFTQNKKSAERFEIMLSSSTLSLFNTTIIKVLVDRKRPKFQDKTDSFPSGHASMSFNFASVVTAEHGILWGIPAYITAAFISFSRVNDGWHWTSDLAAGATIGLSYGWGVYFNRRKVKPSFWFAALPGSDKNSLELKFGIPI